MLVISEHIPGQYKASRARALLLSMPRRLSCIRFFMYFPHWQGYDDAIASQQDAFGFWYFILIFRFLILRGSGLIPSQEITCPRNVVSVTLKMHFFLFNLSPDSRTLSRTCLRALSCCLLSLPKTMMSSWSLAAPLILLIISEIFFWNTSAALCIPNVSDYA